MTTETERLEELIELMVMFTAVDSPNAHRAREAFGLANALAAETARLRRLLAALREPVVSAFDSVRCIWCHVDASSRSRLEHAPDCPWLAVQAESKNE